MKNCFIPLLLGALLPFFLQGTDKKRPNLLFIIADDQSPFDFKAYNPGSELDAPVLGALGSGGM
ncbi:MAG: sulfatase, partial [Opitutae bacterium]|nr:sulfatase [Opitutae bacterium]